MRRSAAVLLAAWCVSLAGCDGIFEGERWRPAEIVAVSAPESLIAGDAVPIRVYSIKGCTEQTLPTQFVAVNDTMFELYVAHGGGSGSVGCPAGPVDEDFVLSPAPSGRFHVRCRGADTLDITIWGGAQPAPVVRHTFRILPAHVPAESLLISVLGCHSEGVNRSVCGDTLALLPIGVAPVTFEAPCYRGGTFYFASVGGAVLYGTLYCRQPWQTIIRR